RGQPRVVVVRRLRDPVVAVRVVQVAVAHLRDGAVGRVAVAVVARAGIAVALARVPAAEQAVGPVLARDERRVGDLPARLLALLVVGVGRGVAVAPHVVVVIPVGVLGLGDPAVVVLLVLDAGRERVAAGLLVRRLDAIDLPEPVALEVLVEPLRRAVGIARI